MEQLNTPEDISRDLIHFIAKSPSVFHAVRGIKAALLYAGFEEIREEDAWHIEKGKNRGVLAETINYTRHNEDYCLLKDVSDKSNYFKYQKANIKKPDNLPSHMVVKNHIKKFGKDYRYETKKNPVPELQDRTCDNVNIARKKQH